MKKYIIFGNYGNETIGLLAWAKNTGLTEVTVVSVDTGWQAKGWQKRVKSAEQLANDYQFQVSRLKSKRTFADLIQQQGDFPSTQYQWCAGFLKALPFIDWLDEVDPDCSAILMLGNRRALSKGQGSLPEYIDESEHFGERRVWHPLYQHTDTMLHKLVASTPLDWLSHRSLECDPCVNNSQQDFLRLQQSDCHKTVALEKTVGKSFFNANAYHNAKGIEKVIEWVEKNPKSDRLSAIDMGCGSPFACGL